MMYINIPKDIHINIGSDWIKIKGPFGTEIKKKSRNIKLFMDKKNNKLFLLLKNVQKKHFYLSLINNIILGLSKGFLIKLVIIGVGYKAAIKDDKLVLRLGYSHDIIYDIPKNVNIKISQQKQPTLIIHGNNISKITQVAAEIRSLRPPEPYKGKGIRYFNEIIKQKEGKKN